MYVLRNYQQAAVDAINDKWNTGARYALLSGCVGCGKSLIITTLTRQFKRVLILQPALELVQQNYDVLKSLGLECVMISSACKNGDWDADIIYTTPQTFVKHINEYKEPDCILWDEVHLLQGGEKIADPIISAYKHCKVAGLTATPYYTKSNTEYKSGWMWNVQTTCSIMSKIFGDITYTITREDMADAGYGPDIIYTKVTGIPILKSEHMRDRIYQTIVDTHTEKVFKLLDRLDNAIIFCDSMAQAKLLADASGGRIHNVFGTSKTKERKEIVKLFKEGKIRYVATHSCLQTGFNYEELQNIVILRNVNTKVESTQMVGRLNRGSGTKRVYYIGKLAYGNPVVGEQIKIKIRRL